VQLNSAIVSGWEFVGVEVNSVADLIALRAVAASAFISRVDCALYYGTTRPHPSPVLRAQFGLASINCKPSNPYFDTVKVLSGMAP
jgi:hypothetical protein